MFPVWVVYHKNYFLPFIRVHPWFKSMSEIAIRVKNISKHYQIYDKPLDRFKQGLMGGRKQYYHEFSALDNISFEVKKGESVGIIGRNGSGKSTLLQIISGTLTPTSGEIEVNGRVAALLELGAGFNPEFTGKENIYMNAAILGLTKKETDARYDEIVTFAEIEEFIDQPVKTYSSGMMVRLAFAVQVAIEPDILIVDEALSVGDFFFQQKCFAKIKSLQLHGKTLLFVSHDTGAVRDLCSKCVYLKGGKMLFVGDNIEAIRKYLAEDSMVNDVRSGSAGKAQQLKPTGVEHRSLLHSALWQRDGKINSENSKAVILAVGMYDASDHAVTAVKMGSEIVVRVMYQVFVGDVVHITLTLKNKVNQIVTSTGSYPLDITPPAMGSGGVVVFELRMRMMLEAGEYGMRVGLGIPIGKNFGEAIDETPWLGPVRTVWDYVNDKSMFYGLVGLPCDGSFVCLQADPTV